MTDSNIFSADDPFCQQKLIEDRVKLLNLGWSPIPAMMNKAVKIPGWQRGDMTAERLVQPWL